MAGEAGAGRGEAVLAGAAAAIALSTGLTAAATAGSGARIDVDVVAGEATGEELCSGARLVAREVSFAILGLSEVLTMCKFGGKVEVMIDVNNKWKERKQKKREQSGTDI